MHTIGQIAKRFALSRSTLLYYDTIGLLSPSGRSQANYRLYTDNDVRRMEQIQMFRETGLPLETIKTLLQAETSSPASILADRLQKISEEIACLRQQQHVIIKLIGPGRSFADAGVMTKARWVSTLAAAGLDEDGMDKWHAEFERSAPQAHHDFLASLGLDAREISLIRENSRAHG